MDTYVHGYSITEMERLADQANTLSQLLHSDSIFPSGSKILEAGCGVGAQTEIICKLNPDSSFYSIDISPQSLQVAVSHCMEKEIGNVEFKEASIYELPFPDNYFDHVFVCFVLEHLSDVDLALRNLRRVLKPGGTIMIIEGDHGSTYFHPNSKRALKVISCLIELQAIKGGDSLIGRKLLPVLQKNGFEQVMVSPRLVYVDNNNPDLIEGFTKNTFIAMVEGVREDAIRNVLVTEREWEEGINDLRKTAEKDGVFCYCFFKATGFNMV